MPYDVESRIREAFPDGLEQKITREISKVQTRISAGETEIVEAYEHPERPPAVIAVGGLIPGQRATIEGRVSQVEDMAKGAKGRETVRWIVVGDDSGDVRITFTAGHGGADIQPGQLLRVTGKPRQSGNHPMSIVDPCYRVMAQPEETQ